MYKIGDLSKLPSLRYQFYEVGIAHIDTQTHACMITKVTIMIETKEQFF